MQWLNFKFINSYPCERMQAFYERQFYPAIFAFLGFGIIFFIPAILHSTTLLEMIFCYSIFLWRIIGIIIVKHHPVWTQQEQSALRLETITAIFYLLLGLAYARLIFLAASELGHSVMFLGYTIFFFLTLGALRTSVSSFKSSVGIILGGYLSSMYLWQQNIDEPLEYIFIYISIPSFIIYLLKTQYDFAKDFVLRTQLLYEQQQHIVDLKKTLDLEKELKLQQELTTQNARLAELGQMASGIAHEINNPLTIISLHIKSLLYRQRQGKLRPEEIERSFEHIIKAVDRTSKIVSSLRVFARDEKLSEREKLDLKIIIDESLTLIARRFALDDISLSVDFVDKPPFIAFVNRVACSQVLLNLLSNAWYEMKKQDHPERWCKLEISEQKENFWLKVIDAGQGVPEEYVKKLFTPFFTSKKVGEGTGLGLSISKSMMQDMGGDLFYDQSAKNTTFVMVIPRNLKS